MTILYAIYINVINIEDVTLTGKMLGLSLVKKKLIPKCTFGSHTRTGVHTDVGKTKRK